MVEAGAQYSADYVVGQNGQLLEEMDTQKVDQLIEQAPIEEQPVTEDSLRNILEQTVAQKPKLFDQTSNQDMFYPGIQQQNSEFLDKRMGNTQDFQQNHQDVQDYSSRRSVSPLDLEASSRDRGVGMQDFASNNRNRGVSLESFDRNRRNEDAVLQDRNPFGRDRDSGLSGLDRERDVVDFGRNRDLGVGNNMDRRRETNVADNTTRRRGLDFGDRDRRIQDRASSLDLGARRGEGVGQDRGRRDGYLSSTEPTKDIFAGTSDKKQCKFCDKLIGVEYQFCPFCGFKQEK